MTGAEKAHVNTLEENSEVILTILAALAQEELNSLSLNVKMGKRMAMQEGRVFFQYTKCYAYQKGADDQPEIIPAEAEIILQKTFISDPITKKVIVNNGQLPKILIKNNHPAIVSREIYDQVQQECARRGSKRKVSKVSKTGQSRYSGLYALGEILICGECCTPYKRAVWRKRGGERQAVWRCISCLDYGTKYCKDSVTVDEESLHEAIMQAIHATRDARRNAIPFLSVHPERSLREKTNGGFMPCRTRSRHSAICWQNTGGPAPPWTPSKAEWCRLPKLSKMSRNTAIPTMTPSSASVGLF